MRAACLFLLLVLTAGSALAQQMPSMDQMLQQLQKEQGGGLMPGQSGQAGPAGGLTGMDATREALRNSKDLTPEQQYWLGRSVGALILGAYKPWDNEAATAYVNLLGQALAAASTLPETFAGWRFLILDSEDVNALSAPGGFVFLTKGLIRCCKTEEALAAVLAHEIGHVELRHGVQAIKQARLQSALTGFAMENLKEQAGQEVAQLVNTFEGSITDVFQTLVVAGYSRQAEAEADLAAVRLLRAVGYSESGLVDMLLAMEERLDPAGKDFARTHPSPAERYKTLKQNAPFAYQPVTSTPARRARFQAALGTLAAAP